MADELNNPATPIFNATIQKEIAAAFASKWQPSNESIVHCLECLNFSQPWKTGALTQKQRRTILYGLVGKGFLTPTLKLTEEGNKFVIAQILK
jgi:hypothetical protein